MAKSGEAKGFCMFFDWIEDLKYLPGEDAFAVVEALALYYKEGTDPVEVVPDHLRAIVSMMYHQIQRREEISAVRAESARAKHSKADGENDLHMQSSAKGVQSPANDVQSSAMQEQSPATITNTITNTNIISPPIVPPLRGGNDVQKERFAQFWEAYPRKSNKERTRQIWKKLNPSEELLDKMLSALESHKQSDQWTRDGGAFIPHPSTWLNGKRWEDDMTPRATTSAPKVKGQPTSSSFDTDDFFAIALSRSYGNLDQDRIAEMAQSARGG